MRDMYDTNHFILYKITEEPCEGFLIKRNESETMFARLLHKIYNDGATPEKWKVCQMQFERDIQQPARDISGKHHLWILFYNSCLRANMQGGQYEGF
jgi:hypothetical protein